MAIYAKKENGELSPLNLHGYIGKDGVTPEVNIEVNRVPLGQNVEVVKNDNDSSVDYVFNIPHADVSNKDKIDYMGNKYSSLKDTSDANVEWLLDDFNTVHYEGQQITATNTFEKQVKSAKIAGKTHLYRIHYGEVLNDYSIISNTGEVHRLSGWVAIQNLIKLLPGNYIIEDDGQGGDGYTYIYFYDIGGGYRGSEARLDLAASHRFSLTEVSYIRLTRRRSNVSELKILSEDEVKIESSREIKIKVSNSSEIEITEANVEAGKYINAISGATESTSAKLGIFSCPVEAGEQYVYEGIKYCSNLVSSTNGGRMSWKLSNGRKDYTADNKEDTIISVDCTGNITLTVDMENLDKIRFRNINDPLTPKVKVFSIPEDVVLRGIGEIKDEMDLNTGIITRRVSIRDYQDEDELNSNFITDGTQTLYPLVEEVEEKIDLLGQRLYTFSGISNYRCISSDQVTTPTLSIDVPVNISSLAITNNDLLLNQDSNLQNLEESITLQEELLEENKKVNLELLSLVNTLKFNNTTLEIMKGDEE